MLLDYIDDIKNQNRIIPFYIEAGTDVPTSDDLVNWVYSDEGILILNGGIAVRVYNEDGILTYIQSHVVKDNTIFITKMYSTMFGCDYDLVTIDSYPISGGSSSSGINSITVNGVSKTPSNGIINLGYINKQLLTSISSSMTLSPNIYYRNTSTSLSTLTITLGSVSNNNIINEYFVEFTTSSSGTTVSLPSTIKWANEETPTFEASTTYQISIVNNLGVVQKFK